MSRISEKQRKHLEEMRKKRPENWRNTNGAPTKQKKVLEYRALHPDATRYRCAKDTGMSINTVKKWWNSEMTDNK